MFCGTGRYRIALWGVVVGVVVVVVGGVAFVIVMLCYLCCKSNTIQYGDGLYYHNLLWIFLQIEPDKTDCCVERHFCSITHDATVILRWIRCHRNRVMESPLQSVPHIDIRNEIISIWSYLRSISFCIPRAGHSLVYCLKPWGFRSWRYRSGFMRSIRFHWLTRC